MAIRDKRIEKGTVTLERGISRCFPTRARDRIF